MISQIGQIGALLLAAVGGVAGISNWIKIGPERKKILAESTRAGVDSTEVLSRAAIALLDPYRQQIEFLRAENGDLRSEITGARSEITSLRKQIDGLRTGIAT
jgi:hypothetical protein